MDLGLQVLALTRAPGELSSMQIRGVASHFQLWAMLPLPRRSLTPRHPVQLCMVSDRQIPQKTIFGAAVPSIHGSHLGTGELKEDHQ